MQRKPFHSWFQVSYEFPRWCFMVFNLWCFFCFPLFYLIHNLVTYASPPDEIIWRNSHEHNQSDFTPQQTHLPIIHHKWCHYASGSSSHIMDVYGSRMPLKVQCCAWQLEKYWTFTFEMQMSIQEHIQLYVAMLRLFSCH